MINTLIVGGLYTNCYIYTDSDNNALIIDPGDEAEKIIYFLESKKIKPLGIINTHSHADHIGANSEIKKKYSIPIYAHSLEFPALVSPEKNLSYFNERLVASPPGDIALTEGQKIAAGRLSLNVWHTPGHTAGSICLFGDGFIFTGDTIFKNSVGRCDLPGGDEGDMDRTIARFKNIKQDYVLYPGHGPSTTLAEEKKSNPFFR